jgi:hypothetical protein
VYDSTEEAIKRTIEGIRKLLNPQDDNTTTKEEEEEGREYTL